MQFCHPVSGIITDKTYKGKYFRINFAVDLWQLHIKNEIIMKFLCNLPAKLWGMV